jgi:phosphatidylserine/phosphatidylglycerophosphate/cardiolipin synthase-like enzyme
MAGLQLAEDAAVLRRIAIASLLLVGCFDQPAADPALAADTTASLTGSSYVTEAVVDALDAQAGARHGKTWGVTGSNRLAPGWVVQTPPASHWGGRYQDLAMPRTCTSGSTCDLDFGLVRCSSNADCGTSGRCAPLAATVKRPGDAPAQLCVGHSDALLDDIYTTLTAGQTVVDLTSLLPPDGRFIPAIRNAITFLGNRGRPMTVRLLFGAFPVQGVVNSKEVLRTLTRDLPRTAPIDVFVGNFRSSNLPPSWNHSKIVAADGRLALVGGHNLWTQHYLDKNPVHDLSMRLEGPAAADAHRFANQLWAWTCANRSWLTWSTWSVWANRWRAGSIDDTCPGAVTPPAAAPAGDATVIAVGRLAWVDPNNAGNDADLAIDAMLRAARETIVLSQQDLGPPTVPVLGIPLGSWPNAIFDELGAAMARGVDVYLVLSNPGAVAGGLSATVAPYANGWEPAEVVRRIRQRLAASPVAGLPTGAALDALLCDRLHVAPLRFGPDDAFPDGVTFPNHAKLVMVDGQAAYIGSQNLYDAGLSEHGYIVDDAAAIAELAATYWEPLWTWSAARAVSGDGTCAF